MRVDVIPLDLPAWMIAALLLVPVAAVAAVVAFAAWLLIRNRHR
jgi:hypothetical protein